jgi:hypothetical protein
MMSVTRRIGAGAVALGLTGAGLVLAQSARAVSVGDAAPPAPIGVIGTVPGGATPGTAPRSTPAGHGISVRLTGNLENRWEHTDCPVDESAQDDDADGIVQSHVGAGCYWSASVLADVVADVRPDGTAELRVSPSSTWRNGVCPVPLCTEHGPTWTTRIDARPGSTFRVPYRVVHDDFRTDVTVEVAYR